MPRIRYRCVRCGQRCSFGRVLSGHDAICENCGGTLHRINGSNILAVGDSVLRTIGMLFVVVLFLGGLFLFAADESFERARIVGSGPDALELLHNIVRLNRMLAWCGAFAVLTLFVIACELASIRRDLERQRKDKP